MTTQDRPLIDDIDAFLSRHDLAPVTFGREAMNDPHFVRDLRRGRRLWPETEAKVRAFMEGYSPPEASPPFQNPPRRTVERHPAAVA